MGLRRDVGRGRNGFLTDPSALIQARALAAGVTLPPGGSFRDAVLQEIYNRDQNLKYAETFVHARLASMLAHLVIDLTQGSNQDARHAAISADVTNLMAVFESELYGDRYHPAFQQAEARKKRMQQRAKAEQEAREAAAIARATKLSDD